MKLLCIAMILEVLKAAKDIDCSCFTFLMCCHNLGFKNTLNQKYDSVKLSFKLRVFW